MTRRQPRLLLITPDFPPRLGGIQRMLGELATGLSDRWDLAVIAPRGPDADKHDVEVQYTVKRTRTSWGGVRSAAVLAEMIVLAQATRRDVVVAGHLATLPVALAVAGNRKTAAFLYGSELWAPKTQRILHLFAKRPSTYLAISRFTAAAAVTEGVPADRIEIVEPGVAESPRPADWRARLARLGLTNGEGAVKPFFLTVARLAEPHKGQDVVIRALPPLLARNPDVRYVIAGDGPLRPQFERIAKTSGVERSVVFTGQVDEATKWALLAGCRALVMPSREARAAAQFEGFGLVYLEAALSGRPSIGGDAGAAPEVVIDGETGLLVNPQSPLEVLEAMLRLANDPHLADELGERARMRAAGYTWSRASGAVDRVLRRLL